MKPALKFHRSHGFSLVEVMVGLTIGLVASIIISQVIASSKGQQSTSRGGADSQENGLFSTQTIANDLRSAGSGFASTTAFGCYQSYSSYGSGSSGSISWLSGNGLLAPVSIKSVKSSSTWTGHGQYQINSDVITVRDAGRLLGAATATLRAETNPKADTPSMTIDRLYGFQDNDVVMISDGATCTFALADVTHSTTSSDINGGSGMGAAILKYTQTATLPNNFKYATNNLVFNVGHVDTTTASKNLGGINEHEYSVPAGTAKLQLISRVTGASTETAKDLADGIVAIKAEYGIVEPKLSLRNNFDATQKVAHWVGPDSGTAWTTTLDSTNSKITSLDKVGDSSLWDSADGPKAAETAKLIKAIRITIVARSSVRESAIVTQPCTASGSRSVGPCPWGPTPAVSGDSAVLDKDTGYPDPIIDLTQVAVPSGKSASGADAEWKHYRYRIYTTIVPVRALVWNPS